MQLNRISNIEPGNDQVDFDQLEREIGQELEDEAVDVNPSPGAAQQASRPVANAPPPTMAQNTSFIPAGRGRPLSKFMPAVQQAPVRSGFLSALLKAVTPAAGTPDPKRAPQQPQAPLLDSKFDPRLRQKPANDVTSKTETNTPVNQDTPRGSRSRVARATVDALLAIGALPMQFLVEIGRFRQAKESRFGSLQRLEKGLGQGDDDAVRYAQSHPELVKKKDLAPPVPTGPK